MKRLVASALPFGPEMGKIHDMPHPNAVRAALGLSTLAVLSAAVAGVVMGAAPESEVNYAPRSTVTSDAVAIPSPTLPQVAEVDGNLFDGLSDGEAIYAAGCASCHGTNLQGGSGSALNDGIWRFGGRRNQVRQSIANGIPQVGMPAYDDGLTDEQLDAVTDYILDAQAEAGPQNLSLPATYDVGDVKVHAEQYVDGLKEPWGLCVIEPNKMLVTEKAGDVHWIIDGKVSDEPVKGTPRTKVRGQGGMMAVSVDPEYADNGWVYLGYSHPKNGDFDEDNVMTRIVRGKIVDNEWTDEEVLFEAKPEHYRDAGVHFGTRIVFPPDGKLYFSIGDRGAQDMAQDITRPNGKIHRINRDGSIPEDNPFVGESDAYESIYSFGHRNPQGISVDPDTGRVWNTEHGPLGGDELNLVGKGNNYGWPEITYGRNYNGTIITDEVVKEGMEQPRLYWNPSTAVCGLEFYSGDLFADWDGQLLVGALKYEDVRRVKIDDDNRVVEEQVIFKQFGRVRDVTVGPDGAIYVVTNGPGRIVKLTPAE